MNQMRGLLAEFGIVVAQGSARLRRALAVIQEERDGLARGGVSEKSAITPDVDVVRADKAERLANIGNLKSLSQAHDIESISPRTIRALRQIAQISTRGVGGVGFSSIPSVQLRASGFL
jgi:hypothetical protein